MARYNAAVLSAAALGIDAAAATIVPGAAVRFKLRRLTLGVAVTSGSIVSQQVVVGINRGTARGTQTTNVAGSKMDPTSAASGITGVDSAWSVQPTLGATATDVFKVAFNTQSGADLPWEQLEEFFSDVGTANVIGIVNRVTALPANHQLSVAVEWEE